MLYFFIAVVAIIFFVAIVKVASGNSTSPQPTASALTEEQQRWIQKVKSIFEENRTVSFLDIFVECGMPKEIAHSKNAEAVKQAFPFDKNETRHNGYDIFTSYQWAVAQRYDLQHDKLEPIDASQHGLNLRKGEAAYHVIYGVELHEEKTTHYNIAYSGVRWESGLLHAGSISFIGNEITSFSLMDIGRLFISNERILFIGMRNNVTASIPIESVLYYNLYQDGVLIHIPNRKPLLLKFDTGYKPEILHVEDGLNEFVSVLDRIISGTENQKLSE
ncbi:hypothetical protein HQ29_08070 [Porphyromonas canoris]|uniref:hypothetical protein n=1 Tax=Porphyromonas canoris TaxID=36875 RepID=UPI00051CD73D|nr:hypothetical protein [Porphyromonas canoris]KGL51902.1 hypothetical protein HQ29_08070 [Porphyromonas canoris]